MVGVSRGERRANDETAVITMLLITYIAEIVGELTFVSLSGQIWALPFLIYMAVVDNQKINRWIMWTVTTLLLSYPNCKSGTGEQKTAPFTVTTADKFRMLAHPIQVGWNSRNSNTVRSRTVSAACYNMFVQASGIIASNIYRDGTYIIIISPLRRYTS